MKYSEARELMQPGDLIGSSGKGIISSVIKLATYSDITHVAVVLKTTVIMGQVWINQLIESTSLGDGFAGVQINRMSDHVKYYDGSIYWYPLSDESRKKLNTQKMYDFLLSHKGKFYDTPQAILSAIDFIPDSKEDFTKMFCSELSSGGYEAGELISDVNCSEVTPCDQVAMPLFDERQLITL